MPDLTIPPNRPPVQVLPADTPGVEGLLTLAVAVVVVARLSLPGLYPPHFCWAAMQA